MTHTAPPDEAALALLMRQSTGDAGQRVRRPLKDSKRESEKDFIRQRDKGKPL